jgi:GNAT superfamily N-acetyltransferase
MGAVIRRCTVAELESAPNLSEVLEAYERESAMQELGKATPQIHVYRAMEAAGLFHPIGAFDDRRLLGFILPIVVVLPHYGVVAATVESFFVLGAERKRGIGLLLLAHAERVARDLGAKALLLSAPVGSALAMVMPKKQYRHSNQVFVKALA